MFSIAALLPVLISIHLLFGGLVFALFKFERSARFWLAGCLSLSLGLTLVLCRGILPDWLTYSVANLFTLLSWFLFFISIDLLLNKQSKLLPFSAGIVVCHGVFVQLIFVSSLRPYLVVYLSFIWALVSFVFFIKILQFNQTHKNKYVAFMAYIFLGFSIVWGFHVALSVAFDLNLVMDEKFANWFTMLLSTLLSVMRQLDYFAIRYSLISEEKTQIEKLLAEREMLISNLLKANKTAATGALSASIAHELNQPLGASNLNIQFLKMKLGNGDLNPELGKEILDSLEKENQRAATIIRSLRSIFTESDSNARVVQLGDLISNVLDIVKPELKSKNVQIQIRVDDGLAIRVNSSEIEQVILNLLNNAAQALFNSGTPQRVIVIEAINTGKSVQLSISDNGVGVPEDFKSQLFELLSTTKQAGMGLGLWLCKHIVTRYSGSIHYEDAVGGGARFVIELPLN